jgi:hypothetical protein
MPPANRFAQTTKETIMPRVRTQRANKDYKAEGIKKGQTYYKWQFRYGPVIRSATYPRPSQLTQSEYLSQAYSLEEQVGDLDTSDPENVADELQNVADEIRSLGEEQQGKRDNMPDQLQDSETGELLQSRADACDTLADELETAEGEVRELVGEDDEPSLIRVTASPFEEDGDFPWEYKPDAFLDWFWEVFQEAKEDAEKHSVGEAIDALEAAGYTIETECDEDTSEKVQNILDGIDWTWEQ